MASSRTKQQKDNNMVRASMGAGLKLAVRSTSASAEDSRYDEITNSGVKKRITGMDIVVKPSSRKVDRGRMSCGGKR